MTTADLDRLAERLVRDGGAEPAFKGYRGYPATLCASINEEVVHGIPSASRVLRDGDIISLDVGVKLGGYFGDSAVTVPVGQVPERTTTLLRVTRESLERAIAQVQVGGRLSDIGHAVQEWVEAHGFSVVREFVGHGIGEQLHEEPQIPELRPAGPRAEAGRGHGARDRADGRDGPAGDEGAGGRLDGGDARRQPGGALRAHRGGDGGRAARADGARTARRRGAVAR